jgi:hypothetical protein
MQLLGTQEGRKKSTTKIANRRELRTATGSWDNFVRFVPFVAFRNAH